MSPDYTSLVRYFLGELWEDQREQVEERYMLDDSFSLLRDEVELDLIDAYVGGTLTEYQRQHFETNYLVTTERRKAVQAAWLSMVYRERIAPRAIKPPLPWWRRLHQWLFSGWRLMPALVTAAVVAAGVGGSVAIVKQQAAKRHAIEAARKASKSAPPVEPQPGILPPEPAEPEPAPAPQSHPRPAVVRPATPPPTTPSEPTSTPAAELPAALPYPAAPPVNRGTITRSVPTDFTLPAGTEIAIRTIDPIDLNNASADREYRGSLAVALNVNGVPIAGTGANAVFHTVSIERPKKSDPLLALRLTAVTINGQRTAVETSGVVSASDSRIKLTVKGAGAGAATGCSVGQKAAGEIGCAVGGAVGAVSGFVGSLLKRKPTQIPPGLQVKFQLSQAVPVVILRSETVPAPAPAAIPVVRLSRGMTTEEVVAIYGEPLHIAEIDFKNMKIYEYRDLKVTFVDNKLTDVH